MHRNCKLFYVYHIDLINKHRSSTLCVSNIKSLMLTDFANESINLGIKYSHLYSKIEY